MYGIVFDIEIDVLKRWYGDSYNRAFEEIRQALEEVGFEWAMRNLYISHSSRENLTHVYRAINRLSKINWFKESVRDIRAFKVEDWSDFTEIVKE